MNQFPNVTLYKPQNQKECDETIQLILKQKKRLARQKYAERQIDKFVKWSWKAKGKVRSIDIEQLHKRHNIICT